MPQQQSIFIRPQCAIYEQSYLTTNPKALFYAIIFSFILLSIKSMNPTLFHALWQAHPGTGTPCVVQLFRNQCPIRLGVALDASNIKVTGVRRCATVYPALRGHKPGHILSAQELADALAKNPTHFGSKVAVKKLKGSIQHNMAYVKGKKGVLFIQNGWGPTDHIDLWDGMNLKGGDPTYYLKGEQIWFWHIA